MRFPSKRIRKKKRTPGGGFHKQGQGFKVRAAPPLPKLRSSTPPPLEKNALCDAGATKQYCSAVLLDSDAVDSKMADDPKFRDEKQYLLVCRD